MREKTLALDQAIDLIKAAEAGLSIDAKSSRKKGSQSKSTSEEKTIKCKFCSKQHVRGANNCLRSGKLVKYVKEKITVRKFVTREANEKLTQTSGIMSNALIQTVMSTLWTLVR